MTDPLSEMLDLALQMMQNTAREGAAAASLLGVLLKEQSAAEPSKREIERPRDPGETLVEWNPRLGVGVASRGQVRDARQIPPERQRDTSSGLTASARLRFGTPFESAVITGAFNPYDPAAPPVQLPG